MSEEGMTKSYKMSQEAIDIIMARAKREQRSASSALRLIVAEWEQDRHDAERETEK